MQIICENCNKQFNVEQRLIPDDGRYLQCGSCNYKWYFKNQLDKKKKLKMIIKKLMIQLKLLKKK